MTRFAWVLNLDAELELARPDLEYVPRQKLLSQLAEFGRPSRDLLGPGDVVVAPGEPPLNSGFVGRAWCPTPLATAQLARAGVRAEPHPDSQTLRRVNHRLFAHELGGGLSDQHYFTERSELEDLFRLGGRRWLLKRPLSFAGRGQMRFYGEITTKQWAWLDASLAQDGVLAEPLVTPLLELSLHGFVWQDGRYELGRPCVQSVSSRGVFRGIRLATLSDLHRTEETALLECGETVARALHRATYFGPFGVDAYRYELDGQLRFCALSEINARYTMGFSVGFPRHPSELRL